MIKLAERFLRDAQRVSELAVASRVHRQGGYGPLGEVIYEGHPNGCPSVLVATSGDAKATVMANGSVAFDVTLSKGMTVAVLAGHFDATEKRETGVPSNNVWLRLAGRHAATAALVTPGDGLGCVPKRFRVVKCGEPDRAMWFCAQFSPSAKQAFESAVKFQLRSTAAGPALLRLTSLRNTGRDPLSADLWSYFSLPGTQRFVYNKPLWYDAGLPVTPLETVVSATVPYSDIVQLKRVSTRLGPGLVPREATCDSTAFVGDSGCTARWPAAVCEGKLRSGAADKLNRFSTGVVAANRFALRLEPGEATWILQEVLYVAEPDLCAGFRASTACGQTDYPRIARAFRRGALALLRATPSVERVVDEAFAATETAASPAFDVDLPRQPVLSAYARSLWTGVAELYENCRAHGAKMAQGVELGTRDRAQDMLPKMMEDPARVRRDLVHVFGFMIQTLPPDHRWSRPLTRVEKLQGMFPRQYPSRWDDRDVEVVNDNRPYNDGAVWLADALNRYVRETGDVGVLAETVSTVRLTQPESPETSGLLGGSLKQTVGEALVGLFDAYGRHAADSPYGLVQVLYGDWCDPVDMFGTSIVGDTATRGIGRGVQVRLSAHVFRALVDTVDLFEAPRVAAVLPASAVQVLLRLRQLADQLRRQAMRFAWEDGRNAGFVAAMHELRADGTAPRYRDAETGYTLGSMRGTDFDGRPRRELTVQAYGLRMLLTERDWLTPVADAARRAQALLRTCDRLLFAPRLGLKLFEPPIANDRQAQRLVGRMGVLPTGCAENGEYHHGQMMMHRFRALVPGNPDTAWAQFKPMVSALRDESLAGPFDMPATSYASEADDPHFGKGMYFGLSGSTDWILTYLQELVGLELSLHDDRSPALRLTPRLPRELGGAATLRRTVHVARGDGTFRPVPMVVTLKPCPVGEVPSIRINGVAVASAEVLSLEGVDRLDIEWTSAAESQPRASVRQRSAKRDIHR